MTLDPRDLRERYREEGREEMRQKANAILDAERERMRGPFMVHVPCLNVCACSRMCFQDASTAEGREEIARRIDCYMDRIRELGGFE